MTDKDKIKEGNCYEYWFSENTEEFDATGLHMLTIKITCIRSGVIFYEVIGHPEIGEGHFEFNSYMAKKIQGIKL